MRRCNTVGLCKCAGGLTGLWLREQHRSAKPTEGCVLRASRLLQAGRSGRTCESPVEKTSTQTRRSRKGPRVHATTARATREPLARSKPSILRAIYDTRRRGSGGPCRAAPALLGRRILGSQDDRRPTAGGRGRTIVPMSSATWLGSGGGLRSATDPRADQPCPHRSDIEAHV